MTADDILIEKVERGAAEDVSRYPLYLHEEGTDSYYAVPDSLIGGRIIFGTDALRMELTVNLAGQLQLMVGAVEGCTPVVKIDDIDIRSDYGDRYQVYHGDTIYIDMARFRVCFNRFRPLILD